MKRVVQAWIATLLFLIAGSVAAQATAPPKGIQLPPETVKLRPSKLAGYGIAMQRCAICHSADYIAYQPPGMKQTQWTAEVSKMHATYGAPIDDTEIRLVGIYLTATYGDVKSISGADLTLPAPATSPALNASATTASGAIDVQALLTQNACLSCHALSQKIVGPAYHDVAAKYKSDPQAASKLESSIRLGGSGRWGSTQMPAFPGLNDAELNALAVFVLKQ
jgi:cytochrome c551/c552